jgi:hypothetical protein
MVSPEPLDREKLEKLLLDFLRDVLLAFQPIKLFKILKGMKNIRAHHVDIIGSYSLLYALTILTTLSFLLTREIPSILGSLWWGWIAIFLVSFIGCLILEYVEVKHGVPR